MQKIRKTTLLLGFVLACNAVLFCQSRAVTQILEIEQVRFAAMEKRDTASLRTMLDNDLIYLHSNGLQESKSQHLAAIASGGIVYQSMNRAPNPTVRCYKKWALVNSQVEVHGLYKGQNFTVHLKYSAVYRKKKRRWLLLNWQSTRVDSE